MDGVKRGMTGSIQFRLSVVLCMAICIVALTSGGVAFFSALDEAHELQDATLTQIAALFKNQSHTLDNSNDLSQTLGSEEDSNVIVQIISRYKTDSSRGVPHFLLRQPLSVGFQTVSSTDGNYRVLVKTLSPDLQVFVAQKTVIRDEVAFDSAWRTLMSFSILLPILLLVVAVLIRKVFRPVTQLATDVSQRHEHNLTPLPSTDIPNEIRPFVAGINQLLGRVESSMAIQKRFIADAAHELRSPLTALSLQAERLSTVRMSTEAHERLSTLRQGINRTKRLLEQLLSLARAQQRTLPTWPLSPVSVQSVYRHVIESLLPLALAKKIDLGVIDTVDEFIHGRKKPGRKCGSLYTGRWVC
ncbi:histidine kinase dimerization/phospho-acceptor domain-containing protein [Yersinia intermedia]|uniref:histidine kinase dimerization/phospho-acceptor domain-containing protein n=1 Tax=Yersinia intermedia TaxID=631 RepID=UPI0022444499|nr:histidine kinase dimerization/phospho-acceptor domain-containing protein [Yersinia intermedia]MCW8114232.1 sensor histidine kinase [Yersinia intermedia]MDA5518999.1 sensor histidine kinase [Yersinia intermedia]